MNENHLSTGEKAKARDIIAAIRTLKAVERERRVPYEDEIHTLRRFGGFGAVALSIFPDPVSGRFKDGWEEFGTELRSLLTPEEYESAKRTTFSQFFTSPTVMSAMHQALTLLDVPEDGVVLEPGCGTGNFMTGSHRYVGVELDSITGCIARLLHPDADIRVENIRDSKLPPLDGVIGNVPFANVHLDFRGQKLSLHDYCIAKSVDALKPGGVLAVVTSHFTLDKQNAAVRELLASQADFIGAIRLPNDAFKREGTAVTTDILFLRKRAPGQAPAHADPEWLETSMIGIEGADLPINRYFCNHPDMVLGDWSREKTLYAEGFSVKPNGDLAEQLRMAVGKLPRFEPTRVEAQRANPPPKGIDTPSTPPIDTPSIPPFVPPPPLKHVSEGSFFVHDKRIHQIVDGKPEPVVYGGGELWAGGALVGRRMGDLIELRDLARRVLQSQNEGWPEHAREDARRSLNRAYDRFHSAYGPINKTTFSESANGTIRRMPNLVKFREDPDAMLVMSLEEYDEATGTAAKAAIMSRDVVGPKPPVTRVTSAEEGLLVSLDHKGGIDLPYIAGLYGKPEAEIVRELGDLIYRDPETKRWETADAYLSGNVRAKLSAAEKAGPEYARNAEALRQVQPEDVLPGDIDANLGAPWIPASDIQAFAADLFGVPAESVKVGHLKKDALWSVEPDYRALNSVAATADYGTSRINGTALLDMALNLKTPAIYDTVYTDGKEQRVINPTETLAAKEKQRQIKERFRQWIFADPDRTERLVRDYNDAFNNLRPRLFDGSHLDFPGMSKAVTLKQHQVDGAWRCMSGGNTLLAHTVGAGKAQPLDAKVLTPTGWKRMGHLRVGDEVIAGDGSVTQVTGVFPQGEKAIWRVAFSDGGSTRACSEHLWLTQDRRERLRTREARSKGHVTRKGRPRVRSTLDIALTIDERHIVPLVGAVHFPRGELPLDPYTLGVLIGNASFRQDTVRLAVPDPIQLDLVRWPPGVTPKERPNPITCPEVFLVGGHVRPNPLNDILRKLGLWWHRSDSKFIPECYLWADVDARLAMLQGLMDTDGTITGRSTRFTTYSRQLASDVRELVRSLGGIGYLHEREGARPGSRRFDVEIKLMGPTCPFRLPRKVAAWQAWAETARSLKRYVAAVEFDGQEPAQCISVAHPSQLYVTDDFIVTHNTWVMSAAAMKMKQAGVVKKPMFVIANNMLEQFAREFQQLYPNARLLVATKDDFTREKRKHLTAKIATGDWDGVLVTHSSFEKIGMSREFQERFLREQIAEYEALLVDKASKGRNLIKTLEKQKAGREERLKQLLAEDKKDNGLVFDELGVDQLFVDEFHHSYKNLETPTKMERVAGIQTGGSERAFDLYMKCRYLDEKHPGHGVVFASGTPVSNTMVEMYTCQRYLDPHALSARGIDHFDGWAATFGEVVEAMEISPDGATLKPRSRFAKFVNLPELVQMFRSFADVQTADMLNLPRPALEGGKPQTVACPMSDEQYAMQAKLVERYEKIRNSKVDPRVDNALAITTDGRKLALDGRMLGAAGDFADSKVNALVRNVTRIWKNTAEKRGTQMVFCDMGVHPNPFSVYDEIVSKLANHGIPAGQIAVIGDADTDAKKNALFEKVRQGTVRVLIGSTSKMGTGTNVQKRLVALHHLDAPWKPAEVEQREGRILRQGNTNAEVAIYRYVTEGSFDAYMWQALETKARFIAQVMTGDCAVRKAEDVGGQELSYAEVKAIASGNPAVLTLAETDAELQRLAILRKNHHDEQFLARRNLRDLPERIKSLSGRIEKLGQDMATLEGHGGDRVTIGQRTFIHADAVDALAGRMERLPQSVSETRTIPVGTFQGLAFGFVLHPFGSMEAYLDGQVFRRIELRDGAGARAVLNALDRLAGSYGQEHERCQQDKVVAEGQLADYQSRIGAVFRHAGYERELSELRDKLKAGLSEKAVEPKEGEPTVAELDAKIKALRAANAVEAAPQRVGSKPQARAERPVTARISRPVQTEVMPEPVQEAKPVDDEADDTPGGNVIPLPVPPKPPTNGHVQQVTQSRKPKQLSLF